MRPTQLFLAILAGLALWIWPAILLISARSWLTAAAALGVEILAGALLVAGWARFRRRG